MCLHSIPADAQSVSLVPLLHEDFMCDFNFRGQNGVWSGCPAMPNITEQHMEYAAFVYLVDEACSLGSAEGLS